MRLLTLCALLAQNVVMVRALHLDEIGRYYIIATVAYLGNAAVFVGADLALQRRLSAISVHRALDLGSVFSYVSVTGLTGSVLLAAAAALYFHLTGHPGWRLPLLCCLLSLATYLSSLLRNIVLLCDRPHQYSLLQVLEAAAKLAFIFVLTRALSASAEAVAIGSAAGSVTAAIAALALLLRITTRARQSYRENTRILGKKLLSIGSAGILNWGQLQAYRPFAAAIFASSEIVGSVSLLSMLGSTAANAVASVIGQMNVPRQYASQGATSAAYARQIGRATAITSVAMIPVAYVFLLVTGKASIAPLLYIVAAGVIVESGNALIGVAVNHCNVGGHTLWHISLGSLLGCIVTAALLSQLARTDRPHALIALALVAGQATSVTVCWLITLRLGPPAHVER